MIKRIYPALIVLCLWFPASSQSVVVWHQQGASSSQGASGSASSLYIGGDMQFSNRSGVVQASQMIIGNSRVKLTGNLINDVERGTGGGQLLKPLSDGFFEFCGTRAQSITTSGTSHTDIPSKGTNYIDFPNLTINNSSHVTLDARLAARTQDIDLTTGWLILASDVAQQGVDGGSEVNQTRESVLAHLLVSGEVNYNMSSWSAGQDINQRGFIQVDLKVPGEGNASQKSLVGFGSPFERTYTDYLMFNTLLEFNPAGKIKGVISDPKVGLEAGKGYVVGIDLRGTDPDDYPKQELYPGIDFAQRATDGYRFNRSAFSGYAPDNQLFGAYSPTNEAYTLEKLNTQDVSVDLVEGYNYLSNPYTCPLSIEQLLEDNSLANDWQVTSGEWDRNPDLYNRVWLLGPTSMAEVTPNINRSKYTYNYLVAMNTGGTYINGDAYDSQSNSVTAIAPLQLFVVYSYKNMPLTIPRDERVMGTTRFLRKGAVKKQREDDFIIEFRDMSSKTSDRLSFVLRPENELSGFSDVERMVSSTSEGTVGGQSYASQVFMKDDRGKEMTVRFLSLESTKRIQLYHLPPLEAQEIEILGQRLYTRTHADRMWLTDRQYPDLLFELLPDMVYRTYSHPGDDHDRFAIVFSKDDTGIETDSRSHAPYPYDDSGHVYVKGFTEADFGSQVSLYDLNGRLLAHKQVESASLLLSEHTPKGVYVVRIAGYASHKLVVR